MALEHTLFVFEHGPIGQKEILYFFMRKTFRKSVPPSNTHFLFSNMVLSVRRKFCPFSCEKLFQKVFRQLPTPRHYFLSLIKRDSSQEKTVYVTFTPVFTHRSLVYPAAVGWGWGQTFPSIFHAASRSACSVWKLERWSTKNQQKIKIFREKEKKSQMLKPTDGTSW